MLTSSERRAADAFEKAVHNGISDCFDVFDVDFIKWHQNEIGTDSTLKMLREHAGMLNTWHLAIDALLGDMLTCTVHSTSYSVEAKRYIEMAVDTYHRTVRTFEHALTQWSLGVRSGGAYATYPAPTHSVNFATQSLD